MVFDATVLRWRSLVPIYTMRCPAGHEHEDLYPMGTVEVPCPQFPLGNSPEQCGLTAARVPSNSIGRSVVSGGTPIFHRRQLKGR